MLRVGDLDRTIKFYGKIVKGIDAVSREQMVQIMAAVGIRNSAPVFSMVPAFGPLKPAALFPTITEEDKIILINVQKVVEFLTAGTSKSSASSQVSLKTEREKKRVMYFLMRKYCWLNLSWDSNSQVVVLLVEQVE